MSHDHEKLDPEDLVVHGEKDGKRLRWLRSNGSWGEMMVKIKWVTEKYNYD